MSHEPTLRSGFLRSLTRFPERPCLAIGDETLTVTLSSPTGGAAYMAKLEADLKPSGATIATVIGRYYAMDRDKRWERNKLAWDAIVLGRGEVRSDTPRSAILAAYERDPRGVAHVDADFLAAHDFRRDWRGFRWADRSTRVWWALQLVQIEPA